MAYFTSFWATPLSAADQQFFARHFGTRPTLHSQIQASSAEVRKEIQTNFDIFNTLRDIPQELKLYLSDLVAQTSLVYHQKSVYLPDLNEILLATLYKYKNGLFGAINSHQFFCGTPRWNLGIYLNNKKITNITKS